MEIREVKNKAVWESFLERASFYPLFQSWNWAEVQKTLGFEIERFGIYEKEKLIGVFLIVEVKARRGYYLHVRHGPVLSPFNENVFDSFVAFVKDHAKKRGAVFIRISPLIEKQSGEEVLNSRGFVNAPIHNMDAELCWLLPLDKSEEMLLSEMRKTHRYLIRKAGTLSIKITKTKDPKEVGQFLALYKDLSKRKHFVPHKGISEELAIFGKDNQALLFLATYDKKVIGGALVDFVGNMAIYHHGAQHYEYRDIPVSYLLQWEAIKEAKKRKKEIYNFWGIAPENAKKHPWQGHTLFKKGFGGMQKEFIHAKDIPLGPGYLLTYGIEFTRKKLRGY